jgi:hypothetical protein
MYSGFCLSGYNKKKEGKEVKMLMRLWGYKFMKNDRQPL